MTVPDVAAIQLLVSGRVQGVGYRWWTTRTATELAVSGWVRNLFDGRVEVYAEGPAAALDALQQACLRGPQYAEVTDVLRKDVPVKGVTGFRQIASAERPDSH